MSSRQVDKKIEMLMNFSLDKCGGCLFSVAVR